MTKYLIAFFIFSSHSYALEQRVDGAILKDRKYLVSLAANVLNGLDPKNDSKIDYSYQGKKIELIAYDYANNLALFKKSDSTVFAKGLLTKSSFEVVNEYGERHLAKDLEFNREVKASKDIKINQWLIDQRGHKLGLVDEYVLMLREGKKSRLVLDSKEFKNKLYLVIPLKFIEKWVLKVTQKKPFLSQPYPLVASQLKNREGFQWGPYSYFRHCSDKGPEKRLLQEGNDGAGIGGNDGAGIGGDGEFIQDFGINFSLSLYAPKCDFIFRKSSLQLSYENIPSALSALFSRLKQTNEEVINYFSVHDDLLDQVSFGEFKDARSFLMTLFRLNPKVYGQPTQNSLFKNSIEEEFLSLGARAQRFWFDRRSSDFYRGSSARYNEKLFFLHNVIYRSFDYKTLSLEERINNRYYEIYYDPDDFYERERNASRLMQRQQELLKLL